MKNTLNIANWNRKDHYHFFKDFEEPFFGITVNIDCTKADTIAKGKMTLENGLRKLPVAVHVHHALMDGFHVAQFVGLFQQLMNKE